MVNIKKKTKSRKPMIMSLLNNDLTRPLIVNDGELQSQALKSSRAQESITALGNRSESLADFQISWGTIPYNSTQQFGEDKANKKPGEVKKIQRGLKEIPISSNRTSYFTLQLLTPEERYQLTKHESRRSQTPPRKSYFTGPFTHA